MSHNHDHNHDHEVITLVDEQGNETLFEILLTIDGREESPARACAACAASRGSAVYAFYRSVGAE